MLGSEYERQNCSVARSLELIGERWSLLIVRDLLGGECRFSDLERGLGVAEKAGLQGSALSTYRLTSKGRDLFPVIAALMLWGDAYLAPDGPPVTLKHRCGADYVAAPTCAVCGESLDALSVHGVPGPGGSKQHSRA